MVNLSNKGISRNIVAAIVTVVVIGVAIAVLSFTSPGGLPGGGGEEEEPTEEEVASVVIDDGGFVGGAGSTLIRLTVRNDGNVDVKLSRITVEDTDVEGAQIQTVTLKPGDTAQVDVGLTKGKAKTGSNTLTFTIETNKGDFTTENFVITVE